MTNPNHNNWPPRPQEDEPVVSLLPISLRQDGRALTYADAEGATLVQPVGEHDFRFSAMLHEAGLSGASVTKVLGEDALYYSPTSDLVSFASAFNASVRVPEAWQDPVFVLEKTAELLKRIQKRFDTIPAITSLDDIAFDKSLARVEFLPPFQPNGMTPMDVFEKLREDGFSRARQPNERALMQYCFEHAVDAFQQK